MADSSGSSGFFKLGSLVLFVVFLAMVNMEYSSLSTGSVASPAEPAAITPIPTPFRIKHWADIRPLIVRHSNSPIPIKNPHLIDRPDVSLKQPFVIFYTECTGTSLLVQALNAHPHTATIGYDPLDVMVHQRFNVKDKYLLSSSQEALAKMIFSYPGPGADGSALVQWRLQIEEEWPQVNDDEVPMKTASEFLSVSSVGFRILPRGIANPERFQNQLIRNNVTVIVMRRDNVGDQAICTYAKVDNATHIMAEGSGSIDLDPARLRYFLATKSHQAKYMNEILVPLKARLPTLELTYEMFEKDPKGTYNKVFKFLGVGDISEHWAALEPYSHFKLTPKHKICGFVHNYAEVCNSIHNRPKLDWAWDLLPCCHCCEGVSPDPLVTKKKPLLQDDDDED